MRTQGEPLPQDCRDRLEQASWLTSTDSGNLPGKHFWGKNAGLELIDAGGSAWATVRVRRSRCAQSQGNPQFWELDQVLAVKIREFPPVASRGRGRATLLKCPRANCCQHSLPSGETSYHHGRLCSLETDCREIPTALSSSLPYGKGELPYPNHADPPKGGGGQKIKKLKHL